MKRIIFIIAFIIVSHFCLYSQNISLPVFRTTGPERLSEHITKGITNDSDKIVAIHKWITNNIKYDVKKWLNFNYDPVPLNKVLKKRKANCLGYSELFNEVCKYAGINSVKVTGYVKDMNIDIVDDFYLDEHAWNAVLLDKKWKFADDCWDAGHIEYSKITFFGHIVKLVTFGKKVIIKYKPRFVKDPSDDYFLKNGNQYKHDHIALNPLWQLMEPNITINQFKTDSSFHYFLTRKNDNWKYDDASDKERLAYFLADENYKIIADGTEGNKFNFRNHYCLANAWYAIAENEFSKINPESVNKVEQAEFCDTVIYCTQKALTEYDTNASFLHRQKNELLKNNIIKKNTCIQQNNKLIRSTKYVLRNLNNGITLSKRNIKYSKKLIKFYYGKLRKLKKNTSFYKKKHPLTTATIDSLNFYYDVLFTGDSIAWQQDSMKDNFTYQDLLYENITKSRNTYSSASNNFTSGEIMLKTLRYAYYDDYDYYVRSIKDSLISKKYDNDQLLFSDSIFMVKSLYYKLKQTRNKVYRKASLFKNKAQFLTKLKGSVISDGDLNEDYEQNIGLMEKDVNAFSDIMKEWISRYSELKRYCRKQKKITKKELNSYVDEKTTEYGFYAVRSGYIKHHYSALISNNKFHLKKTNELRRKAEKMKKKLEK
ncbi:MAG: transglutaminase domain-containing protein [Bacteroidota bacterium]